MRMINAGVVVLHARTVVVVLDVTVAHGAWQLTYGSDPGSDVAEYITNSARFASRLVELAERPDDGGEVRLARHEVTTGTELGARVRDRTRRAGRGPGRRRVARFRWGLDAKDSVGPHVAAEITSSSPMLTEVAATVAYVPS
jgi:hypothetical protein